MRRHSALRSRLDFLFHLYCDFGPWDSGEYYDEELECFFEAFMWGDGSLDDVPADAH